MTEAEGYRIREATAKEIPELVMLRREMFETMGFSDSSILDQVTEASTRYFKRTIPNGHFRAWVAEADGMVVACIGFVMHEIPPTPLNLLGKEGYIMNLVTRPPWRRRGIGAALLQTVLDTLQVEGIPLASLHATPDGQGIYEAAGFEPSNEMQLLFR